MLDAMFTGAPPSEPDGPGATPASLTAVAIGGPLFGAPPLAPPSSGFIMLVGEREGNRGSGVVDPARLVWSRVRLPHVYPGTEYSLSRMLVIADRVGPRRIWARKWRALHSLLHSVISISAAAAAAVGLDPKPATAAGPL